MTDILLIDAILPVQKFEGKGGWTYVALPTVAQNPRNPFGWLQVKGSIDSYQLSRYKLMPMGNGHLFLPLKAELRKQIKKQVGDTVHVQLFLDESPFSIPFEFTECLALDSFAEKVFYKLKESEQERFIKWIFSAKNEDIRVERMAQTLKDLTNGLSKPSR